MKRLKLTNLEKMQKHELQGIYGGRKHIGLVSQLIGNSVHRCWSWCANSDLNTRQDQARWNLKN